jgi:hypothetical protein
MWASSRAVWGKVSGLVSSVMACLVAAPAPESKPPGLSGGASLKQTGGLSVRLIWVGCARRVIPKNADGPCWVVVHHVSPLGGYSFAAGLIGGSTIVRKPRAHESAGGGIDAPPARQWGVAEQGKGLLACQMHRTRRLLARLQYKDVCGLGHSRLLGPLVSQTGGEAAGGSGAFLAPNTQSRPMDGCDVSGCRHGS